jgi:aldose sugar dehydrogenase
MGPLGRVAEFKQLEIAAGVGPNGPNGLQQLRFPATRLSDTPAEARARLFRLPSSHPRDPEFSWKNVVPPAALGFITGAALGAQYDGDLIVGSAVARATNAGHLYRFRLNAERNRLQFDDPRLKDTVADNTALDDFATEGDEIIFGLNFGIVTDIQTGPDGGALPGWTGGDHTENLPAVATSIGHSPAENAFSITPSPGACST